ncbi:flagellar hook assembly protein FlgD [Bacillus spizizenii]|uniref:Flagellar hook assembly protein FlgD n=2 Tax=Bacillus spizizenii TaxID=96241 RepID=A0A9Q4H8W3_BACSC|nr:flagellar hook assembly protein FlgD [Bacillus spizizenii]KFI01701.1 flagellar basal body rod modification protein [Bacillus sp. BSC154]QCJ16935.1 flagellar hook assembly protein FlgD [Bacillus subtilis]ADM37723.1 flagellar basal body rod modification protein [Bacillus spizizenii str. W23]AJW87082.1 flagellar basal body rod modification protein [Bacillus spizizenii]EFG92721.1 flagellar basal body rod modification protein [Bacillus spizizenii ATCC 6633 = JCM 2499]
MTSISSEYKLPEKTSTVTTSNSSLGKDEFLKILMTQVQNQDPLNPVDDKEFISQMATFSSLEQMMNMNKTMTQFVENQDPFTSYVDWLGKEVSWTDGQSTTDKTGTVSSVKHSKGSYYLILDDGTEINPWNVMSVAQSSK